MSKNLLFAEDNAAKRFLSKLSNGDILGIGVFFATIGISMAIVSTEPSLLEKLLIAFVTELGFAFFIAWAIITTVDEREKKNSAAQADKDKRRIASQLYINTALNLDLPQSISDDLSKYLVNSDFIKDYQKVVMKIKPCGNYTEMSQHFESLHRNISSSEAFWSATFDTFDNHIEEVEKLFPDQDWGIGDVHIDTRGSDDDDWESIPVDNLPPGERHNPLSAKVLIPVGGQVRVSLRQTCSKYASDNEPFTNKSLTKQMFFEFSYDDKKYDVSYRASHPLEDNDDLTIRRIDQTDVINFEKPFFPGHGVIVWWRPRDTKTADLTA